jgi:hypothetical protein
LFWSSSATTDEWQKTILKEKNQPFVLIIMTAGKELTGLKCHLSDRDSWNQKTMS